MKCWKNILKITGTWMEKELSDTWTGFTGFVLLKERPPKGYKQPRVQMMYGRICGSICLMQRKRKRNKNGLSRKPKLDNARQLRGIYFIEPDDEEFMLIMKAARRKLEIPTPAAMPCKILTNSSGETGKARLNALALLMPTKARDAGYKKLDANIIRITSLKRRWILWTVTVLFTDLFRCLKQWKFQRMKVAVVKEWEKLKKSNMAADESQKQETSDRWSKD